jgi:hypothetical protein
MANAVALFTRLLSVAIFASVTLGLAACSEYYVGEGAPGLTRAKVEGIWSRSGPGGVVAKYTFTSDGRFTASHIPLIRAPRDGLGNIEVNWEASMNGAGTWSIEKGDQDPPVVDLSYDKASEDLFDPETSSVNEGDYSALLSIKQDQVDGLFLIAGDGDAKYRLIFHKARG